MRRRTCTWRRARPTPRGASCCRPTTPPRHPRRGWRPRSRPSAPEPSSCWATASTTRRAEGPAGGRRRRPACGALAGAAHPGLDRRQPRPRGAAGPARRARGRDPGRGLDPAPRAGAPGPGRGEVAGHLHPAPGSRPPWRRVRRRCFLTDGQRLMVVLAFGQELRGFLQRIPDRLAGLFVARSLQDIWAWPRPRCRPKARSSGIDPLQQPSPARAPGPARCKPQVLAAISRG